MLAPLYYLYIIIWNHAESNRTELKFLSEQSSAGIQSPFSNYEVNKVCLHCRRICWGPLEHKDLQELGVAMTFIITDLRWTNQTVPPNRSPPHSAFIVHKLKIICSIWPSCPSFFYVHFDHHCKQQIDLNWITSVIRLASQHGDCLLWAIGSFRTSVLLLGVLWQ